MAEPKKKTAAKKPRNPNSLANLQKAGEPGHNPNGRPKGTSINTYAKGLIIEALDSPDKTGKTALDRFLTGFIQEATTNRNSWQARSLAEKFIPADPEELDAIFNRAKTRDTDFMAYRVIKTCHDMQQRLILSKEKNIYMMAGRRAGKTEGMVRKGVTVAIEKEGALILYIGLSFSRCIDLFWNPTIDILNALGISISEQRRTDGCIVLANGSELHFKGNTTVDERDKLRGSKWDLVIIDEAQSQKSLSILLNEVIEPTLVDRRGQLVLAGTGPKVRGTYWEELWSNQKDHKALRLNWNLTDNPFIPDHEDVLQKILTEKNLTENSPLFIREYLGGIAYDDDAMVFRLTPENVFTDTDLQAWIDNQPVSDIKFTAGLDYGYKDSDAFVIFMYSTSRPEKFLIYEYKANRNGIQELADAIRKGLDYLKTPLFAKIPNKFCYIYCDTNEQKITYELYRQYGFPTQNALKYDKDFAIEILRDDIRTLKLKVRKPIVKDAAGSDVPDPQSFYSETLQTIYKRNDRDELTHEIDDSSFHPDLVDAILYSLRSVWAFNTQNSQN